MADVRQEGALGLVGGLGGELGGLELARALLSEPQLLLMDEATVGIDPASRASILSDVKTLCRERAMGCSRIESFEVNGVRVSSSAVRQALAEGNFEQARHLLGRAFTITGHVLHGRKLGRTLGFPTLNLRIGHARQTRRPAVHGIFAVRVHGLDRQPLDGVASVGLRPTVDDSGRWLLEVHLFDFSRQVYGSLVSVEFVHKLRDEVRYDTLTELTAAISRDAEQARAVLATVSGVRSAQATI